LRARKFRRRNKIVWEPWPTLMPRDWMRVCLEHPSYRGMQVLGGHRLEDLPAIESMLSQFWSRYQYQDPAVAPIVPTRTIPLFVHGDEGRGQVKRPLMVVSIQPILGLGKGEKLNSKEYSLYMFGKFFLFVVLRRGKFWHWHYCSDFVVDTVMVSKAHLFDKDDIHFNSIGEVRWKRGNNTGSAGSLGCRSKCCQPRRGTGAGVHVAKPCMVA